MAYKVHCEDGRAAQLLLKADGPGVWTVDLDDISARHCQQGRAQQQRQML